MTFNWDVLGKVILELRADAGVAAIAGANPTDARVRVRGFEADPADIHAGNADDPYRAFVVLVNFGGQRDHRVPVQRPRILARCYGRTMAEAAQLGTAVSDAMHFIGPRVQANGLGFYASFAPEGGDQANDPVTNQPYVEHFIDLVATTQAVA